MKSYQNILTFFSIWVLALILISIFGVTKFPHTQNSSPDFFQNLANWDGGHFLGIAQHGYQEWYQYAFFPLYPLLINILTKFTQNFFLSGVLISIISSLAAICLLYKLVGLDFNKKLAERVIIFMLFFPTSFFLLTTYSEGLFLLFTLLMFYFLKKNNLTLAAIFASLASATRLSGLAAVITVLFYVHATQGFSRKNWHIIILAPLGFLLYCYYLYVNTSDPLYFITAERHWQRNIVTPGVSFWETIKNIARPNFLQGNFMALLDLIIAVFGVGMIFRNFRFLPIYYNIFGFASILIPLVTPSLTSFPRFLLPIFPIYIGLALIKNEYMLFAYQLISTMLLGLFVILFLNGYFVA